jgi:predicted nucleotidyltransferase
MIEEMASYFTQRPEVVAVYLFGSYAGSTAGHLSDVDIAVLLASSYEDSANRKRFKYITDLAKILRKDIHPIIMNLAGEEMLRQIFSKGKLIQVNDAKGLSHFKTYAFVKMAEFGYYRASMQRGVIRKIQEEVVRG